MQPNTPISLADLIARHQDATNDSYGTIAKRTGLSKALIGQLAHNGRRRVLQAPTIEKLATGLQLPHAVVQAAAMVTAGLQPDSAATDQRVGLLAAQIARLSHDDFERVELIVSTFANHRG